MAHGMEPNGLASQVEAERRRDEAETKIRNRSDHPASVSECVEMGVSGAQVWFASWQAI